MYIKESYPNRSHLKLDFDDVVDIHMHPQRQKQQQQQPQPQPQQKTQSQTTFKLSKYKEEKHNKEYKDEGLISASLKNEEKEKLVRLTTKQKKEMNILAIQSFGSLINVEGNGNCGYHAIKELLV